jgi:hypothetical protein
VLAGGISDIVAVWSRAVDTRPFTDCSRAVFATRKMPLLGTRFGFDLIRFQAFTTRYFCDSLSYYFRYILGRIEPFAQALSLKVATCKDLQGLCRFAMPKLAWSFVVV